ncbi:MAG: DUF885 domain-containing protein [Gemmatirosa sp.]|nr:DUF885 domain-containing protein [Gemmatirosa sp.]
MDRRRFLLHSTFGAAAFGILRRREAFAEPVAGTSQLASAPAAELAALRERYFVRSLALNPVTATYLGGDAYAPALRDVNARLRDHRPAALLAETRFLGETQRALAAIDRERLSPADRIDHALIGAQIAFVRRQIEERRHHERSIDTYVAEPFRGVDWQLQQMTDAGRGLLGTEAEWRRVVMRLDAVPAYLATARANLLAGKAADNRPDWRMVERDGVGGSEANVAYFRTTLPAQAAPYLGKRAFAQRTLAEVTRAGAAAADAYAAFATWLREQFPVSDNADRFAAGAAEYEWRLRNNLRVERTAAELWEHGAQQVAAYEAKIYAVAADVAREAGLTLAFDDPARRGESVRRVLDRLGADAPADDDELFRWYREAGERAVAYGREHGLFDIPRTYKLDVVPTPPVLRSTIDAAYYAAPPFKKSGVGRFYLTPTGNDKAALAQNNRASVADTAIHEGFPGHDWHYKYMTQHAPEISSVRWLTPGAVEDSSSMWQDSIATEGWGLYSEELMAEPGPDRPYGFYSAAEYLYELQGQLLRAARVRLDVGLHTGRLTFDDAIDYYTEHVAFFPGARRAAAKDPAARAVVDSAQRAIYRYSKWPTQAVTYNLGKQAIVELREADRARGGATWTAKRFHERFMRMGAIPVGYLRESFVE